MPRYPQVLENVRVTRAEVPETVLIEAERINAELAGRGRVLVRASGTEPLVRVLAEAETREEATDLVVPLPGSSNRSSASSKWGAAGLFRLSKR